MMSPVDELDEQDPDQQEDRYHPDDEDTVTDIYTTDGTFVPGGADERGVTALQFTPNPTRLVREVSIPHGNAGNDNVSDDGDDLYILGITPLTGPHAGASARMTRRSTNTSDSRRQQPDEYTYHNDSASVLTDHDVFRASCEAEERRIMADFTFDYTVNLSFDNNDVGGERPGNGGAMSIASYSSRVHPATSGSVWTPLPAPSDAGASLPDPSIAMADDLTLEESGSFENQKDPNQGTWVNKLRNIRQVSRPKLAVNKSSSNPFDEVDETVFRKSAPQYGTVAKPAANAGTQPTSTQRIQNSPPSVIVLGTAPPNSLSTNDRGNSIYRSDPPIDSGAPTQKGGCCLLQWLRMLWGDWLGRAILLCMLVIILAVSISVGSLLLTSLRAESAAAAASTTGGGSPVSSPSPPPQTNTGNNLSLDPRTYFDDKDESDDTDMEKPAGEQRPADDKDIGPARDKDAEENDEKPKDPIAEIPWASPPTSVPTSHPTLGLATLNPNLYDGVCQDDPSFAFYVYNHGLQNCEWLANNPDQIALQCLERLQPYAGCPRTCGACDGQPVSSAEVTETASPTEAATEPPTVATTVATTETPTEAPTDSPTKEPTHSPTPKPATPKPTLAATPKPTPIPTPKPEASTKSLTSQPTEKLVVDTVAPTQPEAALDVATVIRQVLYNSASFIQIRIESNPDSPPARALEWLIETSPIVPTEQKIVQRFVMATLANSLYAFQWQDTTSWLDANASECDWYGTACDGEGQIISIALRSNSLAGSIPPELSLLSNSLTKLDLAMNWIEGSFPRFLGSLTKLTSLQLENNSLRGTVPAQLGRLTRLNDLSFQYNDLKGNVPTELGQLTSLQSITLWNNDIAGSFPDAICEIDTLSTVILDCEEIQCNCWTRCFYQCGGDTGVPCRQGNLL